MKKLILVAMMAIMTLSVSAQTTEFMGIPIEGTETAFSAKLEAKGFISSGSGLYMGKFAGEEVLILTQKTKKDLIYGVGVLWGKKETWSAYKSEMEKLKKLFTQKYGTPIERKDFASPYYDGDGYELSALRLGKCIWGYKWDEVAIIINYQLGILISYENKTIKAIAESESDAVVLGDI